MPILVGVVLIGCFFDCIASLTAWMDLVSQFLVGLLFAASLHAASGELTFTAIHFNRMGLPPCILTFLGLEHRLLATSVLLFLTVTSYNGPLQSILFWHCYRACWPGCCTL